jgi:adenylate cyclase
MGIDEIGTHAALKAIRRELADPTVATHHGHLVKSTGDGFLIEFASVVDAVTCAVIIQQGMASRNRSVPENKRVAFRIGINIGDVIVDEGDIYGDGVNIAARLEALCEPGGICISKSARDQVRDKLPITFHDFGEQEVKNIARPIRVFRLSDTDISALPDQHSSRSLLSTDVTLAGPKPVGLPDKPTIAVMPFDNLSREERWDRVCDGLSEDIITDLARHSDLLVIARNSCFAYKGRSTDVRAIGRALGANYVLEGSIQADGGRTRVTAQLVDTASGGHVWGNRYDRGEAELFAIQDEVVQHVVAAIGGFRGAILRAETMRARRKPPASLRAYELYLMGHDQESRQDRDGVLNSIPILEEAVQEDPQLSRAWTVLGWACQTAIKNNWVADPVAAHARRVEAIHRAAELDPHDGIALEELGSLQAEQGNLALARETLERALAASANYADALAVNAKYVAAVLGREREAMTLMQRAMQLNPHAPPWYFFNLLRVAYFAREFELALDAAARAPAFCDTLLFRALALAQLGRTVEAVATAEEMRRTYPNYNAAQLVERFPLAHPPVRELFLDGLRKAHLIP